MFRVVAIAAIIAVASATPLTGDDYTFLFNSWKAQHGREYATAEEETMRSAIFRVNLDKINAHNALDEPWSMAMNEFGDMTATEFSNAMIGGFVPRSLRRAAPALHVPKLDNPSSVDWSAKGKVTAVKNQGQCGSCWAFSTTGSTESVNAINGHSLVSLSEQQLVDCSGSYGNQGCNGGLMDSAFKYIIANGGLCSEAAYPYHATDGSCDSSCSKVVQISGYTDVARDNDQAMENAVAQQPVSIAIEADQQSFQFYSGGVMTKACGTRLDHGVLNVGYGSDGGVQYWKVKNSWGASWGERGYIRLARGSSYNGGEGQCGIYTTGSYPTQ